MYRGHILVVLTHLKSGGGITEFALNYYETLVLKYNYKVDFLIEKQLKGVEIPKIIPEIKVTYLESGLLNNLKNVIFWFKLAKNSGRYTFIHFHTDSLVNFIPFLLLSGCKNVGVHSHNSSNVRITSNVLKRLLHKLGKIIVRNGHFVRLACSDKAAKWLFDEDKYLQVNNGIDLNKYKFSSELRKEGRKELSVTSEKVFVHVGRLTFQKNQLRLLDIFHQISGFYPNSKLILIGDGEDRSKIIEKIHRLGLNNQIILLGYVSNVFKYLSAGDAVIFPSRYEGLPISLIEAQATGLPVFFSDTITNEVKILNTSAQFSLLSTDEQIANLIVSKIKTGEDVNRDLAANTLKNCGYSHIDVARSLDIFYQSKKENRLFEGNSSMYYVRKKIGGDVN